MDKITIKIQRIARMACALGKMIEDGCDAVNSITGCVDSGYVPAIFYEDEFCKVVVGLTAPSIAALIKPPIQVNGTTNPVLWVNQDGQIIRCHDGVYALLVHLEQLAKNVLLGNGVSPSNDGVVNAVAQKLLTP